MRLVPVAAETLTRNQMDGDLPPWLFVTLAIVLWTVLWLTLRYQRGKE